MKSNNSNNNFPWREVNLYFVEVQTQITKIQINNLSANPTKWLNTLKQFVDEKTIEPKLSFNKN